MSIDRANSEGSTMIPSGRRPTLRTLGLISTIALLIIANVPVRAQTAEGRERGYRLEAMEQALQTKQQFDLYGLHFDNDKATIQPESKSLLDDIATALKNFPDWHLGIIGHTGSASDPDHNAHLSLDRAIAIEAALVDRGVDRQRLVTAGLGESQPIASNTTPDGRALNRRVELIRVTDSALGLREIIEAQAASRNDTQVAPLAAVSAPDGGGTMQPATLRAAPFSQTGHLT